MLDTEALTPHDLTQLGAHQFETDGDELHSLPGTYTQGRRQRWKRRTAARRIAYIDDPDHQPSDSTSPLRRLKTCGLARKDEVVIRYANGRAHATGLLSCGNVWTCATCSERIMTRRCAELETAYLRHIEADGQLGLLTLTMRHSRTDDLRTNLSRLNDSWRQLQQTYQWRQIRQNLIGTVTTVEITHNEENGWHPHLHITLLTTPGTTETSLSAATNQLRSAWSTKVNDTTDRHSLTHGLDLLWWGTDARSAARYAAKLAMEMSLRNDKGDNGALALLDNRSATNTARFIEYANATYRRQIMRWSAGLRTALQMEADKTDTELLDDLDAEDEKSDADVNNDNTTTGEEILIIAGAHWNELTEDERLAWIELAETNRQYSGP